MYYYKLGYDTWDYTTRTVLKHNLKFSKSRFEAIVFKTIEEVIESKIKKSQVNLIEKMEDIFDEVIKILIDKGFKEIKTTQFLIFDGDSNLYSKKHTSYIASQNLSDVLKNRDCYSRPPCHD